MEVTVFPALAGLSEASWGELASSNSIYYTREWLQALAPDIGDNSLLFVAFHAGRPIAALPAFRVGSADEFVYHNAREVVLEPDQLAEVIGPPAALREHPARFCAQALARIAAGSLRPLLGKLLFPNLVFTSPFAYVSEVLIAPDLADPEAAVEALVEAAERYGAANGLGCVTFLWVEDTQRQLLAVLRHRGYHMTFGGAVERLRLPWSDFAGYLGAQRYKRRVMIKHEMARFRDGGGHIRQEPEWTAIKDRALLMAQATQERYDHHFSLPQLAARYRRIVEALGARAVHLGAWLGDELVGFLTAFRHGDVLYPKLTGFDYGRAGDLYVYFNLVYYALIEWALEQGIREIHYGSGAHQAKLARGCEMVPLYVAYRFNSRVMEPLAKLYLPALNRSKSLRYMRMAATYGGRSETQHA